MILINEREGWLQWTCTGFPAPCEPEYQTTRSLLVFRVLLYNLAVFYALHGFAGHCFGAEYFNRLHAGRTQTDPLRSFANLMDSCHAGIISSGFSSMRSRILRRSRVQRSSCGAPRYLVQQTVQIVASHDLTLFDMWHDATRLRIGRPIIKLTLSALHVPERVGPPQRRRICSRGESESGPSP